jgi:hypothetical protein
MVCPGSVKSRHHLKIAFDGLIRFSPFFAQVFDNQSKIFLEGQGVGRRMSNPPCEYRRMKKRSFGFKAENGTWKADAPVNQTRMAEAMQKVMLTVGDSCPNRTQNSSKNSKPYKIESVTYGKSR